MSLLQDTVPSFKNVYTATTHFRTFSLKTSRKFVLVYTADIRRGFCTVNLRSINLKHVEIGFFVELIIGES